MSTRLALVVNKDGQVEPIAEAGFEEIDSLIGRRDTLVWLDIADPTPDDLTLLNREFGLHELAIEDLRKRRQRPKIDLYPGQHVIVAYEPLPGMVPAVIAGMVVTVIGLIWWFRRRGYF